MGSSPFDHSPSGGEELFREQVISLARNLHPEIQIEAHPSFPQVIIAKELHGRSI